MTADIDSLVAMFDDLIKGGLMSHGTLIDEGYSDIVTSMFLRPEPGRESLPYTANQDLCRKRMSSESTTPPRDDNID